MPNIDVRKNKFIYSARLITNNSSSDYDLTEFEVDRLGRNVEDREYRISTNRNALSIKLARKAKKPPKYKIKLLKPKRDKSIKTRGFNTHEHVRRVSKPRQFKDKTPDGFERKLIPDGTQVLEELDSGPFKLRRKSFKDWVPHLVPRLVPIKGLKGNQRKLPKDLRVNDLTYMNTTYKPIGILDDGSLINQINYQTGDPFGFYESIYFIGDPQGWDLSFIGKPNFVPLSVDLLPQPENLPSLFQSEVMQVDSLALKRHFARIGNKKVNLAQNLAEGLQTVNLIADISKRVGTSILALKKGNIYSAVTNLFPKNRKQLANDFLAYRYGISPLLQDIGGAVEHLADYILHNVPGKSNGHAKKKFVRLETNIVDIDHKRFTIITRYETNVRIKYATEFRLKDELLRQATQLGFTDPATVTWELVPFSFVVDWFLPIGDFLQSLTSIEGLELGESYKTVFIKQSVTVTISVESLGGAAFNEIGTDGDGFLGGWKADSIYCNRKVVLLPNLPPPHFKNPISTGHLANALALFVQKTT